MQKSDSERGSRRSLNRIGKRVSGNWKRVKGASEVVSIYLVGRGINQERDNPTSEGMGMFNDGSFKENKAAGSLRSSWELKVMTVSSKPGLQHDKMYSIFVPLL